MPITVKIPTDPILMQFDPIDPLQFDVAGYCLKVRLDMRLTQIQIGELVGVSSARVCDYERGRRLPSGLVMLQYQELYRQFNERLKGLTTSVSKN